MQAKYKRILLKLSGEMLCSAGGCAIEPAAIDNVISEIAGVTALGVEVAVVVGGGNFLRGRDLSGNPRIQRTTADYMGMLATIMNALALRDSMASHGLKADVLSPISDPRVCEPFTQQRANELLSRGHVVILAGGTGSPFFTTDTGAALRASEIGACVLVKATKVDGVFDSDPVKNPSARKYDELTYQKVLADRLGVMDLTAISFCMENRMPVVVFALANPGSLVKVICGQSIGTMVR